MANFDHIGEFGLDQLLAKRLTTPGGSVSPTVAPELFPVITLENDRPEWGFIKGERLYQRRIFMTAVGAQYNTLQLFVPLASRTIAVVEEIKTGNTNAVEIGRGVADGGLAGWTGQIIRSRDMRVSSGSQCELSSNTNALRPVITGFFDRLSLDQASTKQPYILGGRSGDALFIASIVVNQSLDVTVTWRERGAQPGELV